MSRGRIEALAARVCVSRRTRNSPRPRPRPAAGLSARRVPGSAFTQELERVYSCRAGGRRRRGRRELAGNSQTAGVGELGSLGRGSRRHRVEGRGVACWAVEGRATPVSPALFPSRLL